MKKYTKVLASFCAMAMIFSAFSASVFAEEIEPQTEPTVEAAEENGSEMYGGICALFRLRGLNRSGISD